MTWFFANPWGLLALLGLPAVLAIHLLRRRSRQIVVSTLFLVEDVRKSREGGRRFQVPRSSLPLWIQLLVVGVLALLLAAPRWVDPLSTARAVLVMDSSASMDAFREEALQSLGQVMERASSVAGTVEWTVIGSDGSPIARGTSGDEFLKSVEDSWVPVLGMHDPSGALQLAKALAGPSGLVVFVSDHLPPDEEAASGIDWVACGQPTENSALLATSSEDGSWKALIKNFSDLPQTLSWRVDQGEWKTLEANPGETLEISGAFPVERRMVLLELGEDSLQIDNSAPVLVPTQKPLAVTVGSGHEQLFDRILGIAQPVSQPRPGTKADLQLTTYDPFAPSLPDSPALVFVEDSTAGDTLLAGEVIAENHPLMENLNWSGLRVSESLVIPEREGDLPLLWVGPRPVIFLRPGSGGPQLIFNFSTESSNALQLPAMAILLHRFIEARRQEAIGYFSAPVSTGETLTIAGAGLVTAPRTPGFFEAHAGDGSLLFEGAAGFSDLRESDLRSAASGERLTNQTSEVQSTNARGEILDLLLGLIIASLLLWNWWLTGGAPRRTASQSLGPNPVA